MFDSRLCYHFIVVICWCKWVDAADAHENNCCKECESKMTRAQYHPRQQVMYIVKGITSAVAGLMNSLGLQYWHKEWILMIVKQWRARTWLFYWNLQEEVALLQEVASCKPSKWREDRKGTFEKNNQPFHHACAWLEADPFFVRRSSAAQRPLIPAASFHESFSAFSAVTLCAHNGGSRDSLNRTSVNELGPH